MLTFEAGRVFGLLTVIEPAKTKRNTNAYLCECKCGNRKIVCASKLNRGHTRSCGCLVSSKLAARNTTHGMADSKIHYIWRNIKARCNNPNHISYPFYGGKGIKMCKEWEDDFSLFYKELGERPTPKHTVDRIDTNKGYEPGNVRWATYTEQANNRRSNVMVLADGVEMTLANACRKYSVPYEPIRRRLGRGQSFDEAKASYTP